MLLINATSGASASGAGNAVPGCQAAQGTPGSIYYLGVSLNNGVVSKVTSHFVVDDPMTLFMAQTIGNATFASVTMTNKNANAVLTAGSATTLQSNHSVNETGIAPSAGLDLRITRLSNIVPNVDGLYAIVEVLIMKHVLGQDMAGV